MSAIDRLTDIAAQLTGVVADLAREHQLVLARAELDRAAAPSRRKGLLLEVEEVMVELGGLSQSSVRKLIKSGELPSVPVAGRVMVRRADLEAYVAGLATAYAVGGVPA